MFKYKNYQMQAKELARVGVKLLNELNDIDVDTVQCEILCRRLYEYGYINMNDKDEYVLEFIPNGMKNVRLRCHNKTEG